MVADVWEKDVWDFQGKSGTSGSCHLFLHFLLEIRSSIISAWWTFRIFFFFGSGRGRGSPRRQEGGGVGFLLKIPGGGVLPGEGGGGRGA